MTGESPHRKMTDRERTLVGRRRLMQGPVLALRDQVVDADGRIGAPLIALSTLAVMERHGTITREQRLAGERFHELFRRACFGDIKAAPMDRISSSYRVGTGHNGNQAAKAEVFRALHKLGRDGSVLDSCAWHVLGLEWSLTQWAAKATRGNTHQASGVTIATLAILDAHFGG